MKLLTKEQDKHEKYEACDDLFKGIINSQLYIHIHWTYLGNHDRHTELLIIPIEEAIKKFIFPQNCNIVRFIATNVELFHLHDKINFYDNN